MKIFILDLRHINHTNSYLNHADSWLNLGKSLFWNFGSQSFELQIWINQTLILHHGESKFANTSPRFQLILDSVIENKSIQLSIKAIEYAYLFIQEPVYDIIRCTDQHCTYIYILYNILYTQLGKDNSYWKIHCKGTGDRFRNVFQPLNLWDTECNRSLKYTSFSVCVRYFVRNFKGYLSYPFICVWMRWAECCVTLHQWNGVWFVHGRIRISMMYFTKTFYFITMTS